MKNFRYNGKQIKSTDPIIETKEKHQNMLNVHKLNQSKLKFC